MKSNDNIPHDEMLLAEALAAARARRLGFNTYTLFDDGTQHGESASRCCAYGALILAGVAPSMFSERPASLSLVAYGNDNVDTWHGGNDLGESLGWAFRCAMEDQ